ncbi:MAG: hypothetical protein E7010_05740 [Alphaproteobacteria bacterium]|nr:hypothetical protein [Alphaproteobacteria bacterium]
MKEKFEKLEKFMAHEGLTKEELIIYWQYSCGMIVDYKQYIDKLSFPEDDVRSRTQLFWYAFEGGKFSPEPNAYPNCQGVVGWINPDPNAPEGDKIYVVLFPVNEEEGLGHNQHIFATDCCKTGINDLYDGRANTKKWLEYGKLHNIEFPMAQIAYDYCKNGVKKGEAFIPAKMQLQRLVINYHGIQKCGIEFIGGFSSTELDEYSVYEVLFLADTYEHKKLPSELVCIITY